MKWLLVVFVAWTDTPPWPMQSRISHPGLRTLLVLVAMFMVAFTAPHASGSDILDELRQGQHFERDQLFHTGPDVLAEALAGDPSSIYLLALYFENGERGFPADAGVSERLYQKAYDTGHWSSALPLARFAERERDFKRALRLYMLVFDVAAEENQRLLRSGQGYFLHEPGYTHFAYAGIRYLIKSGAVSEQDVASISAEARSEAVNRGFFADCEGRAWTECSAASEENASACRVAIEERCLRQPLK